MRTLKSASDLEAARQEILDSRRHIKQRLLLCSGTGCLATNSDACAEALRQQLREKGLEDSVELARTGCFGLCSRGPILLVEPRETCYFHVQAKDAADIVEQTVVGDQVVERLLYKRPDGSRIETLSEIPFYAGQERILLNQNGIIDPAHIEDYIVRGGYRALAKVLSGMAPEQVVTEVKSSGLRGRGGGGFPTGRKWESTRSAPGDKKYVLVNGDEGDPGAYMDRSLLEANPHRVLEGLIIGAYAIGADEGYFYIREEYPLAVDITLNAIAQARAAGLVGKNILGSGFDFEVHLHRGAGAFVSGESSALMSAIEGNVGEPRSKYIRSSEKGLFDCPSNLNNVETWAAVPLILDHGADWFKALGTPTSTGTKIFSLVGKVTLSGLVEVPMGATLRHIVDEIGGGVPDGKQLKAIQTGGPSGGFLPASMADTPVDFDELTRMGTMMGSGGLVVMDEDTCMVDTARFYARFLADESCGKCVPCREGLRQSVRILDRMVEGEGREGDIELLEELSELMTHGSLCALGQSAANPLLSAIEHFRPEFEAHINEKRCPAGVCHALIRYEIADNCIGCMLCKKACPTHAITGERKVLHVISQDLCIKCGQCEKVCPPKVSAVKRVPEPNPGRKHHHHAH